MAQTAEGSLNEINNNLQRVRELAVQASNGTNSTSDLASLQDEVTARLAEINRVAGKTDFNGIKLLDGTAGTAGVVKIQVGVNDGDTIDLDLSGAKADTTTLGVAAIDLKTMTATDLGTIDAAIAKVDKARSGLGAVQNRFTSAINNLNNTSTTCLLLSPVSRTLTTQLKFPTCPARRSCSRLVLLFCLRQTRFHRPFCLCCVNFTRETPLRRGFFISAI
jgi:flagellin-like hook-associated protein FlgL